MSHIKQFDNFFLPANDLEKGKEFYENKLGLRIKFDFSDRGLIAFQVGEGEPAIILKKGQEVKPAILFAVEDVNLVYEELQSKGVEFISKPFEIMTGRAVKFLDPFGNELGLTDYSKLKK